jgi:phytoene dehydrogenase-like protein
VRLETAPGEYLSIYTNVERMETELLKRAPQDAAEIRRLASAVRRLAKFAIPDPTEPWPRNWLTLLRTLPYLPLLRQWSSVSSKDYGKRFTNPLLRSFFGDGELAQLSALALVFSLAWMSEHNAGYPIGGSQAIIRLIVDNLLSLGGRLRFGVKVEKILVERDAAVGVQLAGGETIAADWVISAADGHATVYDLLGGNYRDRVTDETYRTLENLSLLSAGFSRRGAGSFAASRVRNSTSRRSTPAGFQHPTSGSLIPLLSLRPDICAVRKDRSHLLSSDTQFRVLGSPATTRSGAVSGGETSGRRSGNRHPGKK